MQLTVSSERCWDNPRHELHEAHSVMQSYWFVLAVVKAVSTWLVEDLHVPCPTQANWPSVCERTKGRERVKYNNRSAACSREALITFPITSAPPIRKLYRHRPEAARRSTPSLRKRLSILHRSPSGIELWLHSAFKRIPMANARCYCSYTEYRK